MIRWTVCVLGLCLLLGCAGDTPPADGPQMGGRTASPAPPPDANGQQSVEPASELVKAQPGVGIKGRSLDEHEGMIVTPAKTLFKVKERIAFDIAVPHALDLYKAEHGEGPKTHDEFMQKIVEFNQIKLPQLPPGHVYEYDPQGEQLMVRRPAKPQ